MAGLKNKNTKDVLFSAIFVKEKDRIGILRGLSKKGNDFNFFWSEDGIVFIPDTKKVIFSNGLIKHKPEECSNFRFSYIGKKYYAIYTRTIKSKKYRIIAESINIYEWEVISEVLSDGYESVIPSDIKSKKNFIIYENGSFVRCLVSKDLEKWNDNDLLLFTIRNDRFDKDNLKLIGSLVADKGIIVFYESLISDKYSYKPSIGFVILDKENPYKIIWRSEEPVWKSEVAFSRKNNCESLGMAIKGKDIFFFFNIDNNIIAIDLTEEDLFIHLPQRAHKELIKHKDNPIISPHSSNKWENEAIFNPATLMDDDGHIHLIYRAIGSDGVSRLGYGYSKDGINFNGRLPVPIFAMNHPRRKIAEKYKYYNVNMYGSGGSWGGCEDPRAVRIDGKIYITFNAFDGWDFIRIGVISIDEKDFFNKKWKWNKPILISPSGQINKNWVIFPEKINGKFAILHSISPRVQIDFVNKLEDLENGKYKINSEFKQVSGVKSWDTWVRGVGPPPIKTDKGWLVLYHAMDHRDPNKYKLGALLLDYKDPNKIIGKSDKPLLEPEMWYENDWKPGVVYSSGAVVKNGILFIYYGGGDKHVCVASAPLEKILDKLK